MRYVMAAMPRVQTSALSEAHNSNFRMPKRALEIRRRQRVQHQDPASMKRFEQRKRHFNRSRASFFKLGPTIFVISPDRRLVLRERKLEPAIAVQVTVGHVMYDLPDGPPTKPIRD